MTEPEPSDFEKVRSALRRLNPTMHEHDASWPALQRIEERLIASAPSLKDMAKPADSEAERLKHHGVIASAPSTGSDELRERERSMVPNMRRVLAAIILAENSPTGEFDGDLVDQAGDVAASIEEYIETGDEAWLPGTRAALSHR